jgi:hypothetical protein
MNVMCSVEWRAEGWLSGSAGYMMLGADDAGSFLGGSSTSENALETSALPDPARPRPRPRPQALAERSRDVGRPSSIRQRRLIAVERSATHTTLALHAIEHQPYLVPAYTHSPLLVVLLRPAAPERPDPLLAGSAPTRPHARLQEGRRTAKLLFPHRPHCQPPPLYHLLLLYSLLTPSLCVYSDRIYL